MRSNARDFFVKVLALAFFSSFSAELLAHGWIISPSSRQDHCAKGRTSFDCGTLKYEPQSVEGEKGAMSCSGGSPFTILDSGSWPVSQVGNDVSFEWQLTAPHRTLNWQYFVDGALFATIDGGNAAPAARFQHTLRGLPSGRHQVLAVWNIGDTSRAFYNCVDVDVAGGGGGSAPAASPSAPPGAPAPAPTAGGGSCKAVGAYAGVPGMDQWCESSCPAGNCPPTHCSC